MSEVAIETTATERVKHPAPDTLLGAECRGRPRDGGEVIGLWHCVSAVRELCAQVDEQRTAYKGETPRWHDERAKALKAREAALLALSEATPASRLGDVLAQVMIIFERADCIAESEPTTEGLSEEAQAIRRLAASILPAVACASRLDIEEVFGPTTAAPCEAFVPLIEGRGPMFAEASTTHPDAELLAACDAALAIRGAP